MCVGSLLYHWRTFAAAAAAFLLKIGNHSLVIFHRRVEEEAVKDSRFSYWSQRNCSLQEEQMLLICIFIADVLSAFIAFIFLLILYTFPAILGSFKFLSLLDVIKIHSENE